LDESALFSSVVAKNALFCASFSRTAILERVTTTSASQANRDRLM
jgi:hypothetical protein